VALTGFEEIGSKKRKLPTIKKIHGELLLSLSLSQIQLEF